MLFAIRQGFADINFFETSQPDDVADAGVLQLHLPHSGESEEPGDAGPLAAAIAVNANDRIADVDPTAHDAPQGDPAEVIAVVEI